MLSSEKLLGCYLYTSEIILHSLKLNHHNHMPNPYPIKINPETKSQILNSPLSLPGQKKYPKVLTQSHIQLHTENTMCFCSTCLVIPRLLLVLESFARVSHQVFNVVFIGSNMSKGFNANIWLFSMASAENQYTSVLRWDCLKQKKKTTQTHNPYTHTAVLACSLPRTPCCPGAKLHLSTCT